MNIKKLNEELERIINNFNEEYTTDSKFLGYIVEIYPENRKNLGTGIITIDHSLDIQDEDVPRLINGDEDNYKVINRHFSNFEQALNFGLRYTFTAFPGIDCETDYTTVDTEPSMSRESESIPILNIELPLICRGSIYDTEVGNMDKYLGMLYISGVTER